MTTYRRASEADVPALARLRRDMAAEEHPDEPEDPAFEAAFAQFARGALRERWTAWVADDGGTIVATAWVHAVPKVPRPNRPARSLGYLTNVYTAPSARDRGVGSELLRHVDEWAEGEGLELLVVWPSERSVAFYERAGFVATDALQRDVLGYD